MKNLLHAASFLLLDLASTFVFLVLLLVTKNVPLSIVLGITVFGDLFLSLSTHIGPHPSAAAFGTVLLTLCAVSAAGLLGAVPLSRNVRRALHHSEATHHSEQPLPAE